MAMESITGKLMMDQNDKSAFMVGKGGLLEICSHASMAVMSMNEDVARGATPASHLPC